MSPDVMSSDNLTLLEELSNAPGVSGAEVAVRAIVRAQLADGVDELREDDLGNLIAFKKGKNSGARRVMLAAHMDEVGLIITVDEGDGFFSFSPVGEVDVRQLPGKMVFIGKDNVPGVIGARAIHLTTAEERRHAIPLETLRIDTGNSGKVNLGDRVTFATHFWQNENSLFGKALDNRLGVAALLALLKDDYENIDLYAVFSSQKELGSRGEMVAAQQINPDIAILIDSALAADFSAQDENVVYESRLGAGAVIYPMYRKTISDPALFAYFTGMAEKHDIAYQVRQATSWANYADALGAINTQLAGIRSITISIPGRNPHTAVGIARKSDWAETVRLLRAGLRDIHTFA